MGKKRNRSSSEQMKNQIATDKLTNEELPPPVRQSEEEPENKKVKHCEIKTKFIYQIKFHIPNPIPRPFPGLSSFYNLFLIFRSLSGSTNKES